MEKEEIQTAKTPEIDQTVAPDSRAETRTADQRWILALQRSAGNRAVGTLLAHAPRTRGVGRVTLSALLSSGSRMAHRRRAGRRSRCRGRSSGRRRRRVSATSPVSTLKSQSMIGAGVALADAVAAELVAMPPDLETALKRSRRSQTGRARAVPIPGRPG